MAKKSFRFVGTCEYVLVKKLAVYMAGSNRYSMRDQINSVPIPVCTYVPIASCIMYCIQQYLSLIHI